MNKCVHHWIIETPNGESSIGVCKKCGESRQFLNSYANPEFGDVAVRRKPQLVTHAQRMWKITNFGMDDTYYRRN